jgi:hypothetical protein
MSWVIRPTKTWPESPETGIVVPRHDQPVEESKQQGASGSAGRVGEIDDKGSTCMGDVRVLCEAVGLDPDDSAHYHEVDLAVRSASLTLARKVSEKSKRVKRRK